MALISLKRYLDDASGEGCQRMLALLVEAVTQHPVDVDHAEYQRFTAEVARILQQLPAEPTGKQLLAAAEAIKELAAAHSHSVTGFVQRQGSELQNMVDMLTQTIKSLGSASEISATNLEHIAVQLKRASALEDIYQLRLRLGECLKNVRDEAGRQRNESQSTLQTMKNELSASQQRLSHHGIETDIDRVTGFAGRSAAEVAIHEAVEAGDSRYVVVAVLGKMQSINARFGYAVGDELLCEFAARVAGRLCSRAAFYRWSGPTVLGILQRSEPLQVVQAEVAKWSKRRFPSRWSPARRTPSSRRRPFGWCCRSLLRPATSSPKSTVSSPRRCRGSTAEGVGENFTTETRRHRVFSVSPW